MRLNKYLSEAGVCSRREADALIEAGRVTLNGAVATLGMQVQTGDEVRADGVTVGERSRPIYLALNKPVGITCTTDPTIDGNIVAFVGLDERIFPIGRLDKDSEGLILLTNDGDIVNEILRAENHHEKEYVVTVDRPITDLSLKLLTDGVRILGVMTQPCRITRTGKAEFRIILTQGLNRQIRRMCAAIGYQVRRLQRVRVSNVHLGALRSGRWRNLTPAELKGLLPKHLLRTPATRTK